MTRTVYSRLPSLAFVCLICGCYPVFAGTTSGAQPLQSVYFAIEAQLRSSPLKRPALISSTESAETLNGDLYAILEQPFDALRVTASKPTRWCEIILLLSNTKGCRVEDSLSVPRLLVLASSSKSQSTAGTTSSEFQFAIAKDAPEYLDVTLFAESGPMGTSQLRWHLQAIPLSPERSFLHMHYSYNTNWLGRMAMQTYFQTLGRGKNGFTSVEASGAQQVFIGGARGAIERNTMRYFLGLECSLNTKGPESAERFHAMADCWYDAVEKYPVQLHEMGRTEYLDLKVIEYRRSKIGP